MLVVKYTSCRSRVIPVILKGWSGDVDDSTLNSEQNLLNLIFHSVCESCCWQFCDSSNILLVFQSYFLNDPSALIFGFMFLDLVKPFELIPLEFNAAQTALLSLAHRD